MTCQFSVPVFAQPETQITQANYSLPGDTSPDTVVPAEIDFQIKVIDELDRQIDRLKTTRQEAKAKLSDMLVEVSALPEEHRAAFIFEAYWRLVALNTHELQRLTQQWIGRGKWQKTIEGIATFACVECGKEEEYLPASRTNYIDILEHGVLCPDCEAKRNLEQKKAEREQEKAWRQRQLEKKKRVKVLRQMPYAEYLQTPEWNETRKRALKRARFQCQLCNAGNTILHVHHRTYENLGDEYSRDLIVLCEKCHAKFHDRETEQHKL